LKLRLIFATVLAFGSIAHAQGFVSNLSFSAGLQGVFPSSTFTKDTAENSNGINANTQSTTKSVGAMGSVRYDFGRHSALDLAVTVNRNSELFEYGVNQAFSRVQTNNAEIIGTYIARLPSNEHLKPFFLIGGGMVRFSPNTAFTSGLTPQVDSKPAFAYGFGTDLKFSDSWAIRLQYRGLVRGEPDFKLFTAASPFGTDLKTHVVEPSIQVVYHF
jgi:opacity protein-like surface antigen